MISTVTQMLFTYIANFYTKVLINKSRRTSLRNPPEPSVLKASEVIETDQHRNVDVRLFHRKTTTRISEKIKEYSEEKKLEYSLEKAKDERFRLKWRKHVRRDAQQRVVLNVDRVTLEVSMCII